MQNQPLFVKMGLLTWEGQLKRVTSLFNSLTDEQLSKEIAPGRNTGIYLMGHLIAVHDAILPLFGLGERLHPELEETFISSPDKSGKPIPSLLQLRAYWTEVHGHLGERLASLSEEQWLQRHNSVSEEDFIKEPHRNKLNVLIGRASHIAYHLGQLVLLKN
ncbi:DinB family protein [Flavitalea sp. BT771]|uniref:DinB family protein n=1 Tax=Flavitalea sp. BT771 TaxID=3063329 RepID=UPI0026E12D6A|nr:DinB family protein [Flavitalea sp. BT771]MDO6433696.1 DinB family protein [Flavitalea sp. BT771]MDV6222399.1 DinB family protein [Flavitalea sp. BT771]